MDYWSTHQLFIDFYSLLFCAMVTNIVLLFGWMPHGFLSIGIKEKASNIILCTGRSWVASCFSSYISEKIYLKLLLFQQVQDRSEQVGLFPHWMTSCLALVEFVLLHPLNLQNRVVTSTLSVENYSWSQFASVSLLEFGWLSRSHNVPGTVLGI